MNRRWILKAGLLAATLPATPALAGRAVVAKDRRGYAAAIDRLFQAWWARDATLFQAAFSDPEVSKPFDARPLFDAYYALPAKRFRGELLFGGSTVIVQVVTPNWDGYPNAGVEGGFATSQLFQAQFYPGLEKPVVQSLAYLGEDLLAQAEWIGMPNAPRP